MEKTLKANITANTADFIKAIEAATKSVGNATDNWANRIAVAQNSLTTASIAATTLKDRIDEAAKAGSINHSESNMLADQMNQASQAAQQAITDMQAAVREITEGASGLGTTIEQFQEIKIAATDAGVPLTDVSSAFEAMDNVMREASNASSDASKTLKSLGVSMQRLQSLSPADRMLALQDALNKEKDATTRAIYANNLFGKSYQNIAKLAQTYGNSVQDAHARGAIATKRQIDELSNLQRQAQTSFQTVATASQQAATASKTAWERFKDAFQSGNLLTVQLLQKAWQGAIKIVDAIGKQVIERHRAETEGLQRNLDSIKEVSDAHQKAATEAENLASRLVDLASQTDSTNASFTEQAAILRQLSHGYGSLTKGIDIATASASQLDELQDKILSANHSRSISDVDAELKQLEVYKDQQRKIIGEESEEAGFFRGYIRIVKDYWMAVGDQFGVSYAKDYMKEKEDATRKLEELNDRYTELMKRKKQLQKEDPVLEAQNKRNAKRADAADRLAEEVKRLERMGTLAGEYDQKMQEIQKDAAKYAKQMGVDAQADAIQKYIQLRKTRLDAEMAQKREQQTQPARQASAELDTIIHQSTLDKYAKMREDAEKKVADMAKKIGVTVNDERIQKYRALLVQEIEAEKQAEQEKADAAKKAEEEKAEAAKKAEQEKAEAAKKAEQEQLMATRDRIRQEEAAEAQKLAKERTARRREAIRKKIEKYGFSLDGHDPNETPAERRRRLHNRRLDNSIQEKMIKQEEGKRVHYTPEEQRRIKALKALNREFADLAESMTDAAKELKRAGKDQTGAAKSLHSAGNHLSRKDREQQKKENEQKRKDREQKRKEQREKNRRDNGFIPMHQRNRKKAPLGLGGDGYGNLPDGKPVVPEDWWRGGNWHFAEPHAYKNIYADPKPIPEVDLPDIPSLPDLSIPEPTDYSGEMQKIITALGNMSDNVFVVKG